MILFNLFCFMFKTNKNLYKYGKYFMKLHYIPTYDRVVLYDTKLGSLARRQQKIQSLSDKRTMIVNSYDFAKDHKVGW